jgi:N-methylhydantoinase B
MERDPELVLVDVVEEKVTRAHAAQAYGVVITDGRMPAVDGAATQALRARLRLGRSSGRQP